MKKEKAKRESPYKGIFRFASEKKQQLTFSVILSVLSSIFGIVPYIAVAVLLQSALEGRLTMEWAVLLPVIALCGFFLKHWLYAKSTLCSHKVAYEIIKTSVLLLCERCPEYLWVRSRVNLLVNLSSLSWTMQIVWKYLLPMQSLR